MVKISDYTAITSIADDDLFDVSQYDAVGLTYNTRSISWLNLTEGITSIPGPLGISAPANGSYLVYVDDDGTTNPYGLGVFKSGIRTTNTTLNLSANNGTSLNLSIAASSGVTAGESTGINVGASGTTTAPAGYSAIGGIFNAGENSLNASGSLSIYAKATSAHANDNYGIDIQTANIGAGTSYIGIFNDDRTPGIGKVLTCIDANGTAEWSTPGAGSNIYGIDGTLTGNRQLLGAGFSLEFGTGASQVSSLRAQSAGAIVFTGNGSYDIDLSGGTGNVNLTCGSGDMVLNGLGSCSISNQLGFEAVVGASGTIELTTPQATIISSPVTSAALDVDSTSQGFLPPRMTTAEMNAIGSPATGLMVYDTTTNQWMGNNGTPGTPNWVIIG